LTLDFEVGRTTKTIEEVLQYKKGTIIKLEKSQKNVIQVYANGKLYANGKALRKDGEIYVKMSEILRKRGDK
jgi:flagellar motor switch protein FliN/FliY